MSFGTSYQRLPLLATLVLLLVAVPAVADELTVRIVDRDALLVGDPTDTTDAHVQQQGPIRPIDAGTAKTYEFEVRSPDNRLEIDLRYDPGEVTAQGPCLRANNLNLHVDGPAGWSVHYPGCDSGEITLLASDVPLGTYTVRVEAEHGSTTCLPQDPANPCTRPGVEYHFETQVWDLDG